MFAIRNTKTGEWIWGTDYRCSPPNQRTSKEQALTYDNRSIAELDFQTRRCAKVYEIVEVKLFRVKGVNA